MLVMGLEDVNPEKSNLQTLNGSGMNLEQAVLAFHYAVVNSDQKLVRESMTAPDTNR